MNELYFFIFFTTSLTCIFLYFKTQYNPKNNSQILSFTNSLITTSVGIYSFDQISKVSCSGNHFNKIVDVYFLAYLCTDLIIGRIYYKKYLGLLEAYIHHIIFILFVLYSLNNNLSGCTNYMYIVEIPTVFLSSRILFSKYFKPLDFLFTLTFFCIRILFMYYLIIEIAVYNYKDKVRFIPVLICMLLLHIYWFNKKLGNLLR
jgi:hypothetical protein